MASSRRSTDKEGGFNPDGFSPVFIKGTLVPRLFHYCSQDDTLAKMHDLGYFNKHKMLLTPNSFIDVIGIDGTARFVVETNQGDVKMRKEYEATRWKDKQDYRVPKKDATGKFLKKEQVETAKTG